MASTKPLVTDVWGESNTSSPDMATPTYIATGFPAPAGVPVKPPRGFVNWLFNFCMNAVRYFCRIGLVEWDAAETDYAAGALVRDTDGFIYGLVGSATTGTAPHSDLTNWFRGWDYPRAVVGQYSTPIQRFLNARQQTGAFVDHLGFMTGALLEIDENWLYRTSFSSPGSGAMGPWNYLLRGANASLGAGGAASNLSAAPWGPLGQVATGAAFPATSCLEYSFAPIQMSSTALSFAFDFSINGASAVPASLSIAIGLGDGTMAANTSDVIFNTSGGPAPVGVAIYATAGGGWAAYAFPPGGTAHGVSLSPTLTRDAPHRCRIDVLGTGADDSSAAKVLFFMDGALEATMAYNMNGAFLYPFIRMTCGAANTCAFNVGRMRLKVRLAGGDVSY